MSVVLPSSNPPLAPHTPHLTVGVHDSNFFQFSALLNFFLIISGIGFYCLAEALVIVLVDKTLLVDELWHSLKKSGYISLEMQHLVYLT